MQTPTLSSFSSSEKQTGALPSAKPEFSFLPTRNQFFFILCAYFLLQAISRGLISETLGLDDAEQILTAQTWSWGYGAQPPLYSWLVICFTKVFGFSSFTMALLKNVLILGIYLLTYLTTRKLTDSHPAAVIATAVLQFMPSVSWEAHRDLTHTILASMMVLCTVLVFLNLKPTSWKAYLLFGLCAGLGTISKYNYLVFFVGLLLAGLCLPSWRPLVLNRRMAVALLLFILISLPNLHWFATHRELALSKAWEFEIKPTSGFSSILLGLKTWSLSTLGQVAPLLAILAVVFWSSLKSLKKISLGGEKVILHAMLWAGVLIVIGICIFSVTGCRHRWLQPILIPTPLLLVAMWHEHFSAARAKVVIYIAGVIAFIVLILAPGRILLTETLRKTEIVNTPFTELARQLEGPLAQVDSVYAENQWLAGNLRMWFPSKQFTAPETKKLYPRLPMSALIWDATGNRPEHFVSLASQINGPYAKAEYFEQVFKYHHTNTMRLGVLLPIKAQ